MVSCKMYRGKTRVRFTHIESNSNMQKEVIYYLNIPTGYKLNILKAGGEAGTEYQYIYPDSCIIYITDMGRSLNAENIQKSGYSSKKFEFLMRQGTLNKDTLRIAGKDEKGYYWQEIIIGTVEFGYINIPEKEKEKYNDALNSIHKRKGL